MSIMRAVFAFTAAMAANNTIRTSSASTTSLTSSSTSTLRYIEDLPQNIADAIIEDATGGFAGPGYLSLDEPFGYYNILEEDDADTLTLSGNFLRADGTVLPASTALYLYFDDGDEGADFVRGQGEVDSSTGDFIATVTDISHGYGRVILSFVVVDPADGVTDAGADAVFAVYAVNNGCSRSLMITLEWDTDDSDLDLYVTEPGGNRVNYVFRIGNVGFQDKDNTEGFGPENFIVFSGLNPTEDPVLGEYTAQVYRPYVSTDTIWTLTARINGEVVWVEEGRFFDGISDDSSSPYDYRSDIFTVSLSEYLTGDCMVLEADEGTAAPTLAAGNVTSADNGEETYP